MEEKTAVCANCGAVFDVSLPKCPYCGTMYEPGAERAYLDKLEDIREDLDELSDVAEETYKKEVGKNAKRIAAIFLAAVAFFLICIGIWYWQQTAERSAADSKAQIAWARESYPKLDAWYEEGDYDAILEFLEEAGDEGYTAGDWEHFHFINAYDGYRECMERRETLTDRETANANTAQYVLSEIMYLCYVVDEDFYDTKEDWELVCGFREDLRGILYGELKFTPEEADALYEEATAKDGRFDYEVTNRYAKKIWKRCITEEEK